MNRKEYVARVNKVIDYINRHIETELSLDLLANVAHFSPFHFHRIFKAVIGENLYDYIQRVRIEKAANLLLYQPERAVTETALNCGFSSSSIFSRAFRRRFGMSATSYRKSHSKNSKKDRKENQDCGLPESYNQNDPALIGSLAVEIRSLPTYRVAYHRHLAGYRKGGYNHLITESFQKVKNWAAARGYFSKESLVIGITYDNPDITSNEKCRYDAAVTIPGGVVEGSGEIGILDLEGGLYAIFRIEVSRDRPFEFAIAWMGKAVDYFYRVWLPDSGFGLADKPCLEIYCRGDEGQAGVIAIEYGVPVVPD